LKKSDEADIKRTNKFHFNTYHVRSDHDEFIRHIKESGLYARAPQNSFINNIRIEKGILHVSIPSAEIDSYIASFIASYIAEKLFESRQSFCFETVLIHPSKLDLFRIANKAGYKTYLYYVCTESCQLNIERVTMEV
jgi:predicted ABC-type ATPase